MEFIDREEELATYNDAINKDNKKNESSSELYVFNKIIDHKKEGNQYLCKLNEIAVR